MSAGTLTLTNNSAAVAGSGTAFTTELAAGDFIVAMVGGIPYTLPVKTINSNTSLTLVSNFTGPTQSGAAWYAVPRIAMNLVTAAVVTQAAEALRGLNYDKQNWQSIFSGTGNVTVKLPDGSTWTGPAWNGIASSLSGKMEKGANLGDVTDKTVARVNLGLGSCATENYDSANYSFVNAPLRIALQNVYDLRGIASHALMNKTPVGIVGGVDIGSNMPGSGLTNALVGVITCRGWPDNSARDACFQLSFSNYFQGFRAANANSPSNYWYGNWNKIWTALNTTTASDGTIKAASPVVKIFGDGTGENNMESAGCEVSRIGVGEYLIEGCLGLNSDPAWGGTDGGFDIPKDRNRQPLIWLDYKINPDGSVLVKTFHRTYPDAPEFARNLIGVKDEAGGFTETIKNGNPIDIPADQYVSVRVEMPSDSLWNQRQEEAREAMEKAERERQQNQQDTQS